jgi:N-methylhydantoinase A/oxoprolinase/acetone carboxylase beta subunit
MDIGDTVTDVVAYREDAGTYAAVESSTTPQSKKLAAFGPEIVSELEKTGLRFNAAVDD